MGLVRLIDELDLAAYYNDTSQPVLGRLTSARLALLRSPAACSTLSSDLV